MYIHSNTVHYVLTNTVLCASSALPSFFSIFTSQASHIQHIHVPHSTFHVLFSSKYIKIQSKQSISCACIHSDFILIQMIFQSFNSCSIQQMISNELNILRAQDFNEKFYEIYISNRYIRF